MPLPETIRSLIHKELNRPNPDKLMQLVRRKGQFLLQEDPYSLANEQWTKELLESWNAFHGSFPYPDFSFFYSKRAFCSIIRKEFFQQKPELFLMLLADRRFLFLEYNEHANHPDYPPLSEIVRSPPSYCTVKNVSNEAEVKLIQNAEIVKNQGFVPTNGHVQTYLEMKTNLEEIQCALVQRKRFQESVDTTFEPFQINIRTSTENYNELDRALSRLFRSYVTACANQGYEPVYAPLLQEPEEHWLGAIHSVRTYLDVHPKLPVEHALVFFHLFSQNAKKLLEDKLKTQTMLPGSLPVCPINGLSTVPH